MKEEESIQEFHMNILEIANTSGALGEKMCDEKLVRKILRSLPKRFDMKVVAIEEAHDISKKKVDEIVGSLQTFEMGFKNNESTEKKNKSIALVSNTEDEPEESEIGTDKELTKAIAILGRQFNKIMKRMDQKPKSNNKNSNFDSSKDSDSSRKTKSDDKGKGIQCHGCEGFGHIKAECPTYLKKQKKGLAVTWSDGESSESDSDEESAKLVTALTSVCGSDSDSSEEEVTFDELSSSYRELCIRSAEVCQQGEKQKKIIMKLEAEKKEHLETIEKLNSEVIMLNAKLDHMSKSIRMQNSGTEVLEEILLDGKNTGDMTGIGFEKGSSSYINQPKSEALVSRQNPKPMFQNREKGKMKKKFQRWRCHHCGRLGHIKPFCFKLYGCPDQNLHHYAPFQKQQWVPKVQNLQVNHNQNVTVKRQKWVPKVNALIAHTSLKVSAKEDWYFESGCSKHMTWNPEFYKINHKPFIFCYY